MNIDTDLYDPYAILLIFCIWLEKKRKDDFEEYMRFPFPAWATRFAHEKMSWEVAGTERFHRDFEILIQVAHMVESKELPLSAFEPEMGASRSEDGYED